MNNKLSVIFVCGLLMMFSCSGNVDSSKDQLKVYKGLYIFGPELKTLTECREGIEYWVTDSSNTLELSYSQMNFEKPYEPVYVELEGNMIETNSEETLDFDSTIVVRKVIKISKEIPAGECVD